ncbi:ABC transporter ATP-binding protein [Piscinibacter sakaiensis]|uniref:ABC transporter ATP-binding protein n=1 Tax=Piscinibacter sakaiensis TaxID=1547922 RepID=UPI003AB037E6
MATVTTRKVVKSFGNVEVIHGIELNVADGEFVVLVGPSGCGKSTLLRMIAGLVDVTSGDIEFDGRRVNDVAPRDRDIAMVFQNYALYPTKTVRQNLGFSLKIRREAQAEIERKVDAVADLLGLTKLLDRLPGQLSGGQRQRVAMGRAIVRQPQVFLFDEPLSNLDALLRGRMRSEIKAMHQRIGTTSIYVTHDQVEAMTLADQIVVMNGGRVEQIGSPLELYHHPVNTFVAGFIGAPQMNFFKGRILSQAGQRVADTAVGVLPFDIDVATDDGREISYGIRPEHLGFVAEGGFEARVKLVEPMGAESLVLAEARGEEVQVLIRDESVPLPLPGEIVRLAPQRGKACTFDAVSGCNLVAA